MKISVVGLGYVGLSVSVLLSRNNEVNAVDISRERVNMINSRICPFHDEMTESFFEEKDLHLTAVTSDKADYKGSDFVVIATPTDYNTESGCFDTLSVESVIGDVIRSEPKTVIVIKSTVPIGFTERMRKKYNFRPILFSPEFLREGKALQDNLYPSRIIVGTDMSDEYLSKKASAFAFLLKSSAEDETVSARIVPSAVAEAVKLFSNAYLAMRVAFFNELDTYAELKGLDTKALIECVCLDKRVGDHYNNPSFGYGGYCLPKDTKQLLSEFYGIPEAMFSAIVEANDIRSDFITSRILRLSPKTVGVYRLNMKSGSDNCRNSAVLGIIKRLKAHGTETVIYEPALDNDNFSGCRVIGDIKIFKESADVIIANRYDCELDDVRDRVFTRDVFFRD